MLIIADVTLPEKYNTFHATQLSPYVETEKYGVNFTEPPPDPIRNKPKKESGGIPLWQQCYNEPREKERQPETSVLKAIKQNHEAQRELGSKKCIKASCQSKRTTNSLHHYMNGLLSTHRKQCPVGRHLMRPTGSPTDIPRMESVGTTRVPRQSRLRATVANAAIHGEDLWPALAAAISPSNDSPRGTDPTLEPDQSSPDTGEKEANAPGAPPSNPETSQRQPTVLETCTKDPLVDEETSLVIVRLPRPSPTSHERCVAHLPHLEYPLIRICPSTLRPHNIILQAPCDLSIPWTMELTIHNQDAGCGPPEYQPRDREADLWGFLVNLERRGFGTAWGPPTVTEITEHTASLAVVEHLKRQVSGLKPQLGRTTNCCVINIRKGNKYNAVCIHGEHPLFQGCGLSHTITLRAPTHTLITIRLASSKEEAAH